MMMQVCVMELVDDGIINTDPGSETANTCEGDLNNQVKNDSSSLNLSLTSFNLGDWGCWFYSLHVDV